MFVPGMVCVSSHCPWPYSSSQNPTHTSPISPPPGWFWLCDPAHA
jgi:hypothetical protein